MLSLWSNHSPTHFMLFHKLFAFGRFIVFHSILCSLHLSSPVIAVILWACEPVSLWACEPVSLWTKFCFPFSESDLSVHEARLIRFFQCGRVLGVSAADMESEWRILRRLPGDLDTQDNILNLAVSPDKVTMFLTFSAAVRKLLLLPVGTATVERSVSTMNRIVSSQRCHLLSSHACQLMQLSIKGPKVPDVREDAVNEHQELQHLIDRAYARWLEQPRRGLCDTVTESLLQSRFWFDYCCTSLCIYGWLNWFMTLS